LELTGLANPSNSEGWPVQEQVWPARKLRVVLQDGLESNWNMFPVQTRTAHGLPEPGANTSFVNEMSCYCPGGCRRSIPCSSACLGCQLHVYGCLWSCVTHNTEHARSITVDAPLTLIFKMGQWGYRTPICQWRRPILHLRLSVTYSPFRVPRMQDQTSLTLHWHSLSGWGREHVAIILTYKGGQYFDHVKPRLKQFWITRLTRPEIVDAPLMLILRRAYPQYALGWFRIEYYSQCFGSLSIVFVDILLDHYIVLW